MRLYKNIGVGKKHQLQPLHKGRGATLTDIVDVVRHAEQVIPRFPLAVCSHLFCTPCMLLHIRYTQIHGVQVRLLYPGLLRRCGPRFEDLPAQLCDALLYKFLIIGAKVANIVGQTGNLRQTEVPRSPSKVQIFADIWDKSAVIQLKIGHCRFQSRCTLKLLSRLRKAADTQVVVGSIVL